MRGARFRVLLVLSALGGCGGSDPTGHTGTQDLGYLAASDLAGRASGGDDLAQGPSQCLDCCRCPGAAGTCDNGVCLVKKDTATMPVPPPDSCGNICMALRYGCSTQCSWQRLNPSTGMVETIVEAGVAAYGNP